MAIEPGIEKYMPSSEFSFAPHQVADTLIEIEGKVFPHKETSDFPRTDPWSTTMGRVIRQIRQEGGFRKKPVTEFGIGDGRNIREAGHDVAKVLGIDIEKWRLEVAGINLVTGPARLQVPVDLWRADVVEFLQQIKPQKEKLSGWTVMCLPQSPEGLNAADRYDSSSSLIPYRTDWDKYGLTLNAATLDHLAAVSAKDLRSLVILSDRVPPEAREKMISQTGWQIERLFKTEHPIQQDPDTGIGWVAHIDDGRRFFEKREDRFHPIAAYEAEIRRQQSLESGLGREALNIYHGLTVYQIKPQ